MNLFAIAAVVLLVVVQAHADDLDANASEECLKESGVVADILANAKKGQLEDDAKLKAHILCWSKKVGLLDGSGEIQEEVVRKRLKAKLKDDDVVDKLVEKCLVKKATPEETAYYLMDCYYKNGGKELV